MTSALDLLRSLGTGRATGTSLQGAGSTQLGGASFADLLDKASGGLLSSGLQVTVGKNAGVDLSDEQLQRLSKIADAAEAQGANRVLVLMDGQALKLDVGVRQVTGQADMSGVVTGVDAVVAAPGAADVAATASTRGLGSLPSSNASLLDVLARMTNR